MSPVRPSTPKGMRDFGPEEVARRRYIMRIIRETFELFGYKPIETPAMENRETLTGKYGDEGDRLIFNVLNSGDYMKDAPPGAGTGELTRHISDKALRYDLTVPFARYVVEHRNEITFPFRRYQMQPVWRADRPQKGRYREFWQCDADIIGSESLMCEVELLQMMAEVFNKLKISAEIIINNKKLLWGMAKYLGVENRFNELTTIIDKAKGAHWVEGFQEEMEKAFDSGVAKKVMEFFGANIDPGKIITSPEGQTGLKEVTGLVNKLMELGITNCGRNMKLARGLDYYTGTIFEARMSDGGLSIAGGGRYDNLTGVFGMDGVSGVGFSFGLDRIYNVMEEQNLFPADTSPSTKVLFVCLDGIAQNYALPILSKVRQNGIAAEMYPDTVKLSKQLKYADASKIPYVIIIGGEETVQGKVKLKDMLSGKEQLLSPDEAIELLFA